jgi:hypothetical protein
MTNWMSGSGSEKRQKTWWCSSTQTAGARQRYSRTGIDKGTSKRAILRTKTKDKARETRKGDILRAKQHQRTTTDRRQNQVWRHKLETRLMRTRDVVSSSSPAPRPTSDPTDRLNGAHFARLHETGSETKFQTTFWCGDVKEGKFGTDLVSNSIMRPFCCSWATVMTIVVNNLWTVLLSAFKIWLVEIQRLLFDCTRLTWIQKTCTSKFKNANTQNIKHQICFRKCTWKPHVLLKKACLWQPLANSFEFC